MKRIITGKPKSIIELILRIAIIIMLSLLLILTVNSVRNTKNVHDIIYFAPNGEVYKYLQADNIYVWKTNGVADFNYNGERIRLSGNFIITTRKVE